MRKLAFMLALLVFIGAVSVCAATSLLTYTSSEYGYTIDYPGDWEVTPNDEGVFVAMTTMESGIPATITVVATPLDPEDADKSFEEIMEEAMGDFEGDMDEQLMGFGTIEVRQSGEIRLNGFRAYEAEVFMSIMEIMEFTTYTVFTVHKGNLLTMMYSYDEAFMAANSELFAAVKKSFRLN